MELFEQQELSMLSPFSPVTAHHHLLGGEHIHTHTHTHTHKHTRNVHITMVVVVLLVQVL